MGTLIGVVIGYVLGARAGEKGLAELREAIETIQTSDEVRDLMSGGMAIARDMLQRASGIVGERLQGSEVGATLRRVA